MKIHLYAQGAHHDDAYIVADAEGLVALRDACDAALRKGASAVEVETQDGEGYALIAVNVETRDPKWDQLYLPYTIPEFSASCLEGRIGPVDVVGLLRYRELQAKLRQGVSSQ